MKYRLFVALAAVVAMSGMAFAQTGQLESSTIQLAPIIATLQGWDTGVTVINTTDNPLTVTNFVFYSTTGEITTIAGKSFTVPA